MQNIFPFAPSSELVRVLGWVGGTAWSTLFSATVSGRSSVNSESAGADASENTSDVPEFVSSFVVDNVSEWKTSQPMMSEGTLSRGSTPFKSSGNGIPAVEAMKTMRRTIKNIFLALIVPTGIARVALQIYILKRINRSENTRLDSKGNRAGLEKWKIVDGMTAKAICFFNLLPLPRTYSK